MNITINHYHHFVGPVTPESVREAVADAIQPMHLEIEAMIKVVQDLRDAVAAETTVIGGLTTVIGQAKDELVDLKAKLTAAIANAPSLSAEDAAALQATLDSAVSNSALLQSDTQTLADAVTENASTN